MVIVQRIRTVPIKQEDEQKQKKKRKYLRTKRVHNDIFMFGGNTSAPLSFKISENSHSTEPNVIFIKTIKFIEFSRIWFQRWRVCEGELRTVVQLVPCWRWSSSIGHPPLRAERDNHNICYPTDDVNKWAGHQRFTPDAYAI